MEGIGGFGRVGGVEGTGRGGGVVEVRGDGGVGGDGCISGVCGWYADIKMKSRINVITHNCFSSALFIYNKSRF